MGIYKRINSVSLIVAFAGFLSFFFNPVCAQENNLASAVKSISDSQDDAQLYESFNSLQAKYLPEHKYEEFVKLLSSLNEKKKGLEKFTDYFTALTRYRQLKYLEERQSWDEYFEKGNDYRGELSERAQRAIKGAAKTDPLNIYSRLILWQFHKDQEDVFAEEALAGLFDSSLEYAKGIQDMQPLKDVADKLLAYGEKGKAKELYRVYVAKLTTSLNTPELKNAAVVFYKEGNLELSEAVYDTYIERIIQTMPKEEVIAILLNIAISFTSREEGPQDPLYAEKVFKKIEELGGEDKFSEEQIYLRAFNLEKAKDYAFANDKYLYLLKKYPQSVHADEALFKAGIISTYVLRDVQKGSDYFLQLSRREKNTPQVISAIYQLGLLKQWGGDLSSAGGYYKQVIDRSKEGFPETTALARERLKEIEEGRPIEYNLKTFLDASLREDNPSWDSGRLPLKASPYRAKKSTTVNVASGSETLETGCLKPEIQYLWSGHLGTARPATDQPEFQTVYPQQGTKEINLVVVSSAGVVDRNIDLEDIY